jgi:hypothetical protein
MRRVADSTAPLCALEEVEEVVEVEEVEEEEEEEDMEVAPSLVKFLYRLSTYYIRSAAVAASPVG